MHVYIREQPVELEMREVDPEGLVPEGSELVAVAFFADSNEQPSFRALLPPETMAVIEEAIEGPVQLGLLAEEPEDPQEEIRAMVGISVPVSGSAPMEMVEEGEGAEPWSSSDPDAWKAEEEDEEETAVPRMALLAFAPLVRLRRRFPESFAEELADLLDTALSGATRPSLQARVDQMLDDL
ncbi:MAG TPA: hypothetical protein VGR27_05565 [Longimicrobiaceae bacterium]|nr:hypothetical protein [Longimicrobiaceae bacterium]